MLPTGPVPPRVSRETRLLLIIALVSLAALWLLARMRFPERTAPLSPVLTQFAPRSPLEEIPALVADLVPRLSAALVPVPLDERPHGAPMTRRTVAALRIDREYAVTVLDETSRPASNLPIVARDPASGLAVLRVAPQNVPVVPVRPPRRVDVPRFLLAGEATDHVVSFRPVFVSTLTAVSSPVWPDTIWVAPAETPLAAGTYLFTTDGALAGLAVVRGSAIAVVPPETVVAMAQRLLERQHQPRVSLGVHVQAITAAMAAAAGTSQGVIVTSVERRGPAAGLLIPTDVIEAIGGTPVPTIEHWRARLARLSASDVLELRVRRGGELHVVEVRAAAEEAAPADVPHGLTLRTRRDVGAEIVGVQASSAAARAGLQVGDVITVIDGIRAPAAADVFEAFAVAPPKQPLLLAITRGTTDLVVTVSRR